MSEDDRSRRRGLVMVYTGDGKGKTTAALGLALRQTGWGRKVLFIQFMKGEGNVYGERLAAQKYLPLLEIEQHGRDQFVNLARPDPLDVELAQRALRRAREALAGGAYDMIVLDEVNVAMHAKLVAVEQVLALLDARPSWVDIVLTGRYAPQEIIERADMVSEVREVKHHYRSGVPAQKGVEY